MSRAGQARRPSAQRWWPFSFSVLVSGRHVTPPASCIVVVAAVAWPRWCHPRAGVVVGAGVRPFCLRRGGAASPLAAFARAGQPPHPQPRARCTSGVGRSRPSAGSRPDSASACASGWSGVPCSPGVSSGSATSPRPAVRGASSLVAAVASISATARVAGGVTSEAMVCGARSRHVPHCALGTPVSRLPSLRSALRGLCTPKPRQAACGGRVWRAALGGGRVCLRAGRCAVAVVSAGMELARARLMLAEAARDLVAVEERHPALSSSPVRLEEAEYEAAREAALRLLQEAALRFSAALQVAVLSAAR